MGKGVTIERSHRLDGIGEYYFSRRLREIAETEAATGRQIIKLAMGSPDLPPAQTVIDTLAREAQRPDVHKYMSYQGEPILRKAFADWYKKFYGVDLDWKTEVYPLIGSKEGLMHVCMTFLNEGDKVLVPNPGYPTYSAAVKLAGGEMVTYALNKQTDFLPDFEAIEKAGLDGVKMMLVNYPNMPTGANATPEIYERLVDFARRKNIVIVNDNPYSFILNEKPISILSVPGAKDCCIEFNSMSKSHNMPGWRIGMLASNAEFVQWILKVKSNIDSGMFRAMQLAAATALEAEADWYEGNNENYRNRRHLAGEIMKALGCTYDEKQVGMFLWGKIPASCKDVEELTEKVLHEARVFITPGFIFGSNGARYIRISLCCKDNKLAEALERIKRI